MFEKLSLYLRNGVKKLFSYLWNGVKWLIDPILHGISLGLAIILTVTLVKLFKTWEEPFVISKVDFLADFLESYKVIVHAVLGTIIICFIQGSTRLSKRFLKGSMASTAGLFFYSRISNKRGVKKSVRFLKKAGKDCAYLCILGASGYNTFVKTKSPLYEALRNCSRSQIILLNPLSKILPKRACDITGEENNPKTIDKYRNEIYDSVKYLISLTSGGVADHIELKFYQNYPTWKLIILDGLLRVQQYPPNDHVEKSPCWGFERKGVYEGGYEQFYNVFNRRWDSLYLGKYNFGSGMIEFFNNKGEVIKEQSLEERRSSERKFIGCEAVCICNGESEKVFIDNVSESGVCVIISNRHNLADFYKEKTLWLQFQSLSKEILNIQYIIRREPKTLVHKLTSSVGMETIEPLLHSKQFFESLN